MFTSACAICGEPGGGTFKVQLLPVATTGQRDDAKRSVAVCRDCRDRLPFDYDAFCARVDSAPRSVRLDDALLSSFIQSYMADVWTEPEPPTYADIAKVLNAVGFTNMRNETWSYHNLRQRLLRMSIHLGEMVAQRTPRQRAEMLDSLLGAARQIRAVASMDDGPAASSDAATANAHPGRRDEAPAEWEPGPARGAAPAGMPGGD